MQTIDYQSTRSLSHVPGVFKLETLQLSRKSYEAVFAEANAWPGSVVILPPWPISLPGPIDVRNIAKISGYNPTLSKIIHLGEGPLFTGIYNYAHLNIFPECSDFEVIHLPEHGGVATFLELGSQQHIKIDRLKIRGYRGGHYIRFVNETPVPMPGLGFGCWTENVRITNTFSYGSPAVGVECASVSKRPDDNSFINFWIDMHFSLESADSVGLLFDRAHVTSGVVACKFNLHAPGTCMKVINGSLLRNNRYPSSIEGPGTRLEVDASSIVHGEGSFIRTDLGALDKISGRVIDMAECAPVRSDGYQLPGGGGT